MINWDSLRPTGWTTKSVNTDALGSSKDPIHKIRIDPDEIAWLLNMISDGHAMVERIEMDTTEGQLVFELTENGIKITHTETDD